MDKELPQPILDDFGRLCTKETLRGLCFFKGQLAADWTYGVGYGPMKLQEAIGRAKTDTLEVFDPEDLQDLDLSLLFHRGYRDLKCTEYNRAGDWPQAGPQ